MMVELVATLHDLCSDLRERNDGAGKTISQTDLAPLISSLRSQNAPGSSKVIADLRSYDPGSSRCLIETENEPWILAASFDSPANPDLKFEFLVYEVVDPDRQLSGIYNSFARSINVLHCSEGLKDNRVVALFPEDLRFASSQQRDTSSTLFFIDRFVERFIQFSLPLLRTCVSPDSFAAMQAAFKIKYDVGLVKKLCADWMWMHEGGHRDGKLPYKKDALPNTKFFTTPSDLRLFKNTWESGAFEEMRADVLGMCKLLELESKNQKRLTLLLEFILLERLVRYPVQYLRQRPKSKIDYDSLGSHILYRYLEGLGCLAVDSRNRLCLRNDWQDGLMRYREQSRQVEEDAISAAESASVHQLKSLKSRLLAKVERDPNLDAEKRSAKLEKIHDKDPHRDSLLLRRWMGREVIEQYVQKMCGFDTKTNRYPVLEFYKHAAAKIVSA